MNKGLVEAAQAGDLDAISALVDEFAPTVLGAAYGWCADWHLAADIAQESFATVVARIGEVRDPAAFPGWLMAVVRTSATRAERRAVPIALLRDERPSDEPGPEAVAVQADEVQRVRLAVEALPQHLRVPVVLHYVAGSTIAEIADLCDVPVSTVKQRMRVARARLRDGMDEMADEMLCRLRPTADDDPTDVIRMYTAMRSGDVRRVSAMLDVRPDLVDVREEWTREDSFAHRLPFTGGGGTPLLRAIERGDDAMVALLLERGADPNGACDCEAGERPLFTAVSHHRPGMVKLLLERGADPNATSFAGVTPLQVAAMRSYVDIGGLLRDAGADPTIVDRGGRTAADWEPSAGAMRVTGIKAVDLWCPLPARGLVRWTPGYGLGSTVLLAELSQRYLHAGRRVVWTGFVQTPTDDGDVAHGLAECGMADDVILEMASVGATDDAKVAAFERGLAHDAGLLVIFEEVGRASLLESHLPALARRACTTIVVGPLDGSATPPAPTGTPYLASVTFDVARARRRRWPAVGPDGTWSRVVDDEGRELAARARGATGEAADRLDEYLSQPFFITEPFIGEPGELVPLAELRSTVSALLDPR